MGESSSSFPWPGGVHRALIASHRDEHEAEPRHRLRGRLRPCGGGGNHRVEQRQRQSGLRASQECPSGNRLLRDKHRVILLLGTACTAVLPATSHFSAPHLKRSALHDSENERREAVSVLPGVAHDLANGRRIVVLDASSQRERQKFLRQRCDKQFGTAQQRVFESVDPSELPVARQRS